MENNNKEVKEGTPLNANFVAFAGVSMSEDRGVSKPIVYLPENPVHKETFAGILVQAIAEASGLDLFALFYRANEVRRIKEEQFKNTKEDNTGD